MVYKRGIIGLHDDVIDKVFFFNWPDLIINENEAIPCSDVYSIVRPNQLAVLSVRFCICFGYLQEEQGHGILRTGVAYIKCYV